MEKKTILTIEEIEYYQKDFAHLINIVKNFPITMKQIVDVAVLLGYIAQDGKLSIYQRVLIDGAGFDIDKKIF